MFELKDEQKQIRSLARELAIGEILPGAQARDRSHEFPTAIVQQLAQMGFMGMVVPEQYGGAGLDTLSYVLALEQVSYADAGVGVIMSVNNSLASWPILRFGTEEQKQKYLVPLAKGDKLGCYALTEPGAGSDAGAQKTRIARDGDHYVLNGTKMWITNGPQADVCVAYASLDPEQRHRAVCAFVLERGMQGYRVGKIEEKLGIHCSSTSEIVFEDLRVSKENLLHNEGEGFKVAMATLDGGRIGIAAQALGIAGRALDLAVAYAKERQTFGRPIKDHQAIQWMIADMATRLDAARLLTYRAAALKDQPDARATKECSMAKLFASECANFCADKALQIHGGYGYSQEYEVERLYRDARITTLYEGTSEIQRLVVSKAVLEEAG
jgi:alkylation response protein AidB-like acyl-CoA dehydrogenase